MFSGNLGIKKTKQATSIIVLTWASDWRP
jgi:hypothetical protein